MTFSNLTGWAPISAPSSPITWLSLNTWPIAKHVTYPYHSPPLITFSTTTCDHRDHLGGCLDDESDRHVTTLLHVTIVSSRDAVSRDLLKGTQMDVICHLFVSPVYPPVGVTRLCHPFVPPVCVMFAFVSEACHVTPGGSCRSGMWQFWNFEFFWRIVENRKNSKEITKKNRSAYISR